MAKKIAEHFKSVDQILYSVIEKIGVMGPTTSQDYFSDLCETIINQQLSDKAAATIFSRFKKLFASGLRNAVFLTSHPTTGEIALATGKKIYLELTVETDPHWQNVLYS